MIGRADHSRRGRLARNAARAVGVALLLAVCAVSACSERASGGERSSRQAEARPLDVIATIGMIGDTPGRFAYPRAIDFDRVAETLWVVDRSGRVQEIDPETGACLTIFRMPDTELGFPVGITVAPGRDSTGAWSERLLYLADTHYQRVVVVEPPAAMTAHERAEAKHSGNARRVEPTIVRMHGRYGTGPGEFIYPTDVAVLVDSAAERVARIYVGEYGSNDRVSVFDGDFNFLFSFGAFGSSETGDRVEFNRPQVLEIEETADAAADVEGSLSAAERADPLLRGRRLLILDARNHRLGVFTMNGTLVRWIGEPGDPSGEPGRFRFPWGLAAVGDGTVLVCDFVGGRIQHVDLRSGRGLRAWGRAGVGPGELNSPWAMVRLPDRRVFVVDGRNNRLLVFRGP
ncbi:MAG: hypothetical protein KF768_09120 [Phycisphaeraceae bacterium]|nr:hypothetical protein [Phycisphaeraceae bacterium]